MKRKVFLAWQSQNRDTAKYVRDQLDAAKKGLELCGIDTDIIKTPTQGESGSPCITDLIWQQIISSDAFVADLSFVQGASCSNSNVMYELGIADALIGENRTILLCDQNTAIDKIAFDVNHKRISRVNVKNNSFHSELAEWLKLCFVEADKRRYIKQYAVDQYIGEILLLVNYFFRFINTKSPNYEQGLTIPSLEEIEGRLRDGIYILLQAKADFSKVIEDMDNKLAHLMQFLDRKLIWYIIGLISPLKAFQRLCDVNHYAHVIQRDTEETGGVLDSHSFILKPGIDEESTDDEIRESIYFNNNTVIYTGESGLSVFDNRTLSSAIREWKKKDVQINKKERMTCIKVQTYTFNEEWIPAFAIRIQNILQSLLDLLQYCSYRITNIDADGNPNGVILLQKEI